MSDHPNAYRTRQYPCPAIPSIQRQLRNIWRPDGVGKALRAHLTRQALRQDPRFRAIRHFLHTQTRRVPYAHLMGYFYTAWSQQFLPQGPFAVPTACATELLSWAIQLHHLLPIDPDASPSPFQTELILVGDFCYTQCLQSLTSPFFWKALQLVAHTAQTLAQMELTTLAAPDQAPASPLAIQAKMARLAACAVELVMLQFPNLTPAEKTPWTRCASWLSHVFPIWEHTGDHLALYPAIAYTRAPKPEVVIHEAIASLSPVAHTAAGMYLIQWIQSGCGSAW